MPSATSPKLSRATRIAGAAFALTMMGAAASHAQQQGEAPPEGWFKVCTKQEDNDICNVQNIKAAATGQLLTAINIIQIKGKVNREIFQIAVPTGRILPPGIGMQIDGGKAAKVPYSICLPDRCIAEVVLSEQLIASLKRGNSMVLTTINFQNQQNPIEMSLSGFTAAFDGPALQKSELEDRNQQLQAEIEKKREEFQKKLKAEQEKAKAGN